MKIRFTSLHTPLAILISAGLISACNWVDSTGRQSNSKPTIILDDGTPDDGFSLTLNEQATARVDPSDSSDDDGSITSWSWKQAPTDSGALDVCADVDGFNSELAASSLEDACTDPDACKLSILTEEVEKSDEELAADQAAAEAAGYTGTVATTKTVFTLTAPQLKAPVGLTYRLTAKDNDGGTGTADVSLCMISINEAPEAVDDTFTVMSGTQRQVLGSEDPNLLSNDSDDIDVSNSTLKVVTTAVEGPAKADEFTLFEDGGFTYFYEGDPSAVGDLGTDSFTYEITDGIHSAQADVTIKLVAEDDPPVLNKDIPDQRAYAGIPFNFNFSGYFSDPEGAELTFGETTDELPGSFDEDALTNGRLSGTPTNAEIGEYALSLSAYDGLNSTEGALSLTIQGNSAPTINNIPDQSGTAGKTFSLDLSKYASDPEGQTLSYSVSGKPDFLSLNGSTLRGKPTSAGEWTITVSVSDGFNKAVSKSFKFEVVNQSPVFKTIGTQTASMGKTFSLNLDNYASDPEGQSLTYSVSGNPGFLSLKNSILSGTPTSINSWNITVTATDPLGAKNSATFTLKVSNSAPTFKTIPSQSGTIGEKFSLNLADYASDADGDTLKYSFGGTPGFLSLNGSVLSGTPASANSWTVTVSVTDSYHDEISKTFKLTVTNPAPVKKGTIPDMTFTVAESVSESLSGYFSDPNGDTLSYSYSGLPAGINGNESTGLISGSALLSAVNGSPHSVTVTASDGSGSVKQSFKIYVESAEPEPNNTPTVSQSAADKTVERGENVSFTSAFSDSDGDPLTFSVNAGGSGLSYTETATSVTVSGTADTVGSFTIKVTAQDDEGAQVSDQYTLTVTEPEPEPEPESDSDSDSDSETDTNSAPVLVEGGEDKTVTSDDYVRIVSAFSDPDGDELACTIDADGSGLDVNPSPTGCAAAKRSPNVGNFTITVTATDPSNATATDTYKLTVTRATALRSPSTDVIKYASAPATSVSGTPAGQLDDNAAEPKELNVAVEKNNSEFLNLSALAQQVRAADKNSNYKIVIRPVN
ncbi:putative Ig domain-containing protein [Granulosicoccaceae sp. 1_MG-2023]|nr:putative Ig domain-containing protein [Granulosicoccaceae sp. 1_MG-2023]